MATLRPTVRRPAVRAARRAPPTPRTPVETATPAEYRPAPAGVWGRPVAARRVSGRGPGRPSGTPSGRGSRTWPSPGAAPPKRLSWPSGVVGRAEEQLLQRAERLAGARRTRRAAASGGWPPSATRRRRPGASSRERQRLAEHHRVGAAAERLGDVAARSACRRRRSGARSGRRSRPGSRGGRRRRRRSRWPSAPGCRAPSSRGRPVVGADADDHAGRAGAHQVQRGLVVGAAADDHREVEVGDELLEVQRLVGGGHVLGRDERALDDQDVDARRPGSPGPAPACAAARPGRRP